MPIADHRDCCIGISAAGESGIGENRSRKQARKQGSD
jgi:hypothetical protein